MADFVLARIKSGGRAAPLYPSHEWYDVGTVSNFEKLNDELARHPLNDLV